MSTFDVRIGINPLTWMNDDLPSLGGETPLSTALTEGKRIGYEGFESGNKFPREPLALKALLARYDLALVSGWYSGRLAKRSAKKKSKPRDRISNCSRQRRHRLGLRRSRGFDQGLPRPLYQRPRFYSKRHWREYAKRLDSSPITRCPRPAVAYHHHMGAYVETPADLDRLVSLTGEAVGLVFDTGHIAFAGGDPLVAVLDSALERVCHVHCKDVRPEVIKLARNRDWSFLDAVINGAFTVPGDGALNFAAIIERLRRHGYRGWLVVEAEQDPVIAASYAYAEKGTTLRSWWTRRRCGNVATKEAA